MPDVVGRKAGAAKDALAATGLKADVSLPNPRLVAGGLTVPLALPAIGADGLVTLPPAAWDAVQLLVGHLAAGLLQLAADGRRNGNRQPRLARSGLSNVHPAAIAHERDERIKRLAGKIDRVLVDAPCSGLGTLRRNPDLKWRQSEQAVAELVVKQTAILDSAARLVKSGGRLVYATCSVLPQENEEVAQAFSQAHPDFVPLDVAPELTRLKVEGGDALCSGEGRFLRLWPHRHATDGFFAAVWVRK
mgnify:CR=1 FL=1